MFEPVSESIVKSHHDAIDYHRTICFRMPDRESEARKAIQKEQEILFDIYAKSLVNLSEVIERLQPDASVPQWYVTDRASRDNMMIECRIDDTRKHCYLSSYQSYLQCVHLIKKQYNFDGLLKAYEEKEQQWGDHLKERLCSYRKLSAFN